MLTALGDLLRYTHATTIVGDILKMRASDIGLSEMAGGEPSLAQVIQPEAEEVSLQVFGGGKGLSTQATVRFLGHPIQVTYSPNILGRVFRGNGTPLDRGPYLSSDPQVDIGGPSVNPVTRIQLLARIAIQADADIVAFSGPGLIFDDHYFFRSTFEDENIVTHPVWTALSARWHNRPVRLPVPSQAKRHWQSDARGSCPTHEHHDLPPFRWQGGAAEGGAIHHTLHDSQHVDAA